VAYAYLFGQCGEFPQNIGENSERDVGDIAFVTLKTIRLRVPVQ
jgi:hypothetical protein